jgi:hypothetical protein
MHSDEIKYLEDPFCTEAYLRSIKRISEFKVLLHSHVQLPAEIERLC